MGNINSYFKYGFINYLMNEEFAILLKKIYGQIGEFGFEDAHMLTMINNATRHQDNLEKIGNITLEHELTKPLQEAAALRCKHLRNLRDAADLAVLSDDADKAKAGEKIRFWIKQVRRKIPYPSIESQSHVVQQLLEFRGNVTGVDEALEKIDCLELFETIVNETSQIMKDAAQRSFKVSELKKEVKVKRKAAYGDFKMLLNTLSNFANVPGYDQDMYDAVCQGVSRMLIEAHAKWSNRITTKQSGDSGEGGNAGHGNSNNDNDAD